MARAKYPWHTWMNSTVPIRLRKYKDYFCDTATMRQNIRNHATNMGAKVSINTVSDMEIVVRVIKEPI